MENHDSEIIFANSKEDIYDILTRLNIKSELKKYDKILLKPNYAHPRSPETGTITSPDFLEPVLDFVTKNTNSEILVGDGCAYLYPNSQETFNISGIHDILKSFPAVKLVDFITDEAVTIDCGGNYLKRTKVAKSCVGCGIINLPTLKEHHSVSLTAGIKNFVGTLNNMRIIHGEYMHEKIFELYSFFEPRIICTLVDGIIAMRNTEVDGQTTHMGIIIGGKDTVLVDVMCANIMNIPVKEIDYLNIALKQRTPGEKIHYRITDLLEEIMSSVPLGLGGECL